MLYLFILFCFYFYSLLKGDFEGEKRGKTEKRMGRKWEENRRYVTKKKGRRGHFRFFYSFFPSPFLFLYAYTKGLRADLWIFFVEGRRARVICLHLVNWRTDARGIQSVRHEFYCVCQNTSPCKLIVGNVRVIQGSSPYTEA